MILSTLAQWQEYLFESLGPGINLGLEAMAKAAEALKLGTFSCPVITVAGTNGKGSTVAYLESIYGDAGYAVGSFTSPHVLKLNERVRLNGVNVCDERFIEAFNYVATYQSQLSSFECIALAAFYVFQQSNVDVVILEVGLGGRLDAVNIIDPSLAIITSIALDHMQQLGQTRELIAVEKAGIMRKGVPVLCTDLKPPQSLITHAAEKQSPLYRLGKDYYYAMDGDQLHYQFGPENLSCPKPKLRCDHAATALTAVSLLSHILPVSQSSRKTGITRARLLGNFQIIADKPIVVVDVAHNPEATRYLAEQLQQHFPDYQRVAVVGMYKDKQIKASLQPMMAVIDEWYLASLDSPRGASAKQLLAQANLASERCHSYNCPKEALSSACANGVDTPNYLVVVFGSFQTVEQAFHLIQQKEALYE